MASTNINKLTKTFDEIYVWVLSLLTAWISGRILLWPALEILLVWIKPGRTDNLSINETNLTLYESRIALTGVIFVALLLLATIAFENRLKLKSQKIAIRAEHIALVGYAYYYWLYQSVYWWYVSPISIDYYQASLIRDFNIIKAISTFCILSFAASLFVFRVTNNNNSKILKRLIIQISLYFAIWVLYFWSSIPNQNLGLPATLVFVGAAISIVFYYFWNSFRNNVRGNETTSG